MRVLDYFCYLLINLLRYPFPVFSFLCSMKAGIHFGIGLAHKIVPDPIADSWTHKWNFSAKPKFSSEATNDLQFTHVIFCWIFRAIFVDWSWSGISWFRKNALKTRIFGILTLLNNVSISCFMHLKLLASLFSLIISFGVDWPFQEFISCSS